MKTINLNNITTVNYKGANINILKLRANRVWPTSVEPVFQAEWHWYRSKGWYNGGPGNVDITFYRGNLHYINFTELWYIYGIWLNMPDIPTEYYEYRTDMPDGSYFITSGSKTWDNEIIQYYK